MSFKEGKFFLYGLSERNGFWKIPLDRSRFPSRETVFLTMWECPLPRHNRHRQQVRIGAVCIWEQILWEKSHPYCCTDKKNGWGKRERKYFYFSVFRAIAHLALWSQLPSVKYVYAVDYKSMIGGYRTLLVINSVNPWLIPLRYLSHVWVTSHQV